MSVGESLPAADMGPPPFFIRALRRLRPDEGWLVYLLALGVVLTLPYAAVDSALVPGLRPAIWLSFLGLSFSWWLAYRLRLPGIAAALILGLSGIVATLVWGVRVLNARPLVGQAARWVAWRAGEQAAPPPSITYFRDQWDALAGYGQRVVWWLDGLVNGPGVPDNLVVIGLAGLLAWCFAAWAGWWIARRGQSFVALLPTGIVLAQLAFWVDDTRWSLITFLGATAMLLVMSRLSWLMRHWDRTGTDYSPEIRLDMVLIGLGIASVTMILAPALPFIASNEFSQAFWRIFESPYKEVETRVSASFEAGQPVRSLVPAFGVAEGGLPRAHLLGGRPELGREIALRVRTRGNDPGQSLYWRGQTFAHYTGRGWDGGGAAVIEATFAAGEPWRTDMERTPGRALVSSVEVVEATRGVIYAAGEPVSADRPYRARYYSPGELVSLSATGAPREYTVLSYLFVPDATLLRATSAEYPPEVTALYLQLPEDLDPRLATFLQEAAPAALPPYDRAIAIETALRRLEYSLDVPVPPEGRELVSWFLFDLQRGYCDYFASAMVVLARMSGIPARLAVGYATGSYDVQTSEYTVTELSAHSWPELYFTGVGWVRFEPTPGQEPPLRIASDPRTFTPDYLGMIPDFDPGLAELRELGEVHVAEEQREAATSNALAVLTGLLLLWSFVRFTRLVFSPLTVTDATGTAYARLLAWGRRMGRPPAPADTPREFVRGVVGVTTQRARRARLLKGATRAAAEVVQADASDLLYSYEAAQFGPKLETEAGREQKRTRRWARLWPALRRVWLAR